MSKPGKRKGKVSRFAKLPLHVLKSAAACSLPDGQFRVLVCYAATYTGYNNGSLGLTREQAERLGVSHTTLKRAQRTLTHRDLLVRTKVGTRAPPRPNLYALTWCPIDEGDHELKATRTSSHEYRNWLFKHWLFAPPPPESDGSKRTTAVGQSDPEVDDLRPEVDVPVGQKEPRSATFDGSNWPTSKNLPYPEGLADGQNEAESPQPDDAEATNALVGEAHEREPEPVSNLPSAPTPPGTHASPLSDPGDRNSPVEARCVSDEGDASKDRPVHSPPPSTDKPSPARGSCLACDSDGGRLVLPGAVAKHGDR